MTRRDADGFEIPTPIIVVLQSQPSESIVRRVAPPQKIQKVEEPEVQKQDKPAMTSEIQKNDSKKVTTQRDCIDLTENDLSIEECLSHPTTTEERYIAYCQSIEKAGSDYEAPPWDIDVEDLYEQYFTSKEWISSKKAFIKKIQSDCHHHREIVSAARDVLERGDYLVRNPKRHIKLLAALLLVGGVVASDILQSTPFLLMNMCSGISDYNYLVSIVGLLSANVRPLLPSTAVWDTMIHPLSIRIMSVHNAAAQEADISPDV
eukprot:TRINITY_DN4129_c0_g2_i10.p1 TRINITY_DN4129_c0_g2~~TRINITY_DN4129_c0_g2_i10.p1  ORF type:complete len:262 (+),score=33.78 TRINITY_DN4129_c0_g2_i10:115-900(+)